MSKALDIAENLALLSTKYTSSSSTLDSVVLGASTTDHASRALTGTFNGTIGSSATFSAGYILQVVTTVDNTEISHQTGQTPYNYSQLNTAITLKKANSKILINFNFGAVSYQDTGNLGYGKVMFKIGSGSYSDVTPIGLNQVVTGGSRHHMAVNYVSANYRVDAGATMTVIHTTSSAKDTVHTYAPYLFGEGVNADVFINRSFRDGDPYDFSSISSCTLIEIAT